MTTLVDPGWPTLLNVLRRLNPSGGVETAMAEMMSQKLALLDDIPWVEGNLPTGHVITSRNGLPSPSWRKFNQGIDPSKSSTIQYEESCGMLEARSEVDVKLARLNGNAAAFRASEDKGFLEGFSQLLETAVLYENGISNPERIHGLTARYPATTGYTSSSYVLKSGTNGGSNCRSIWLINWSPDAVFGIYPKGSQAGLSQKDMGELYVEDSFNKKFLAYVTQFNWDCGIAVKDYRYSTRFQWDPDDAAFADTGTGMVNALQTMVGTVFDMDATRARFYMDRVSFAKFNTQLIANSANVLEYIAAGGRRIPSFMGIPIRITDALVAESAIA